MSVTETSLCASAMLVHKATAPAAAATARADLAKWYKGETSSVISTLGLLPVMRKIRRKSQMVRENIIRT